MTKPAQTEQDQKVHVRRRYLHFAMVPVQLVKSKVISAQAVRAFALLDSYCSWDTNRAHPAHDRLANDMGVSVPTLRRAIKELVDAGYVSVEGTFDERGARTGTIYTLNDPQDVYGMHSMRSAEHDDLTPCSPVITPDSPSKSGTPCSPVITEVLAGKQGPDQGCHPINTDSGQGAVPPIEAEPKATSPSGSLGSESLEPRSTTARTRARVNSARTRTKAPPNPNVQPLLLRHAQCYQGNVGAPYPIAWGKEGAIIKRLLQTYSRDEFVSLQDTFFAQKADSQAALRGYTVQWLEHEASALMARIKRQESVTEEQREIVAALRAEGVAEDVALALATEYPVPEIRRQLRAHGDRRERLRNPAAALVKAIREGWQVPEEPEPDYYQPLRATASSGAPVGPPPPEVQALLDRTIAHLTGKGAER